MEHIFIPTGTEYYIKPDPNGKGTIISIPKHLVVKSTQEDESQILYIKTEGVNVIYNADVIKIIKKYGNARIMRIGNDFIVEYKNYRDAKNAALSIRYINGNYCHITMDPYNGNYFKITPDIRGIIISNYEDDEQHIIRITIEYTLIKNFYRHFEADQRSNMTIRDLYLFLPDECKNGVSQIGLNKFVAEYADNRIATTAIKALQKFNPYGMDKKITVDVI